MRRLEFKRTRLIDTFRLLKPAYSYKNAIHGANDILIHNGYFISSNDTFSIFVKAEVEEDISIVMPAVEVYQILIKSKQEMVIFEFEDNEVSIATGSSVLRFSSNTNLEKSISKLPEVPTEFTVMPCDTQEAITLCSKTTSEINRAYMNVKMGPGKMISTDSYRITEVNMENDLTESLHIYHVLLPILKTANIVKYNYQKVDEDFGRVVFGTDKGFLLFGPTPSEELADLDEYMVDDSDVWVKWDITEAQKLEIGALDGVTKDTLKMDRLCTVDIKNNNMRIFASGNSSTIDINIPVEYTGDNIVFRINVQFMKEAVAFAEGFKYNFKDNTVIFKNENTSIYVWVEGV